MNANALEYARRVGLLPDRSDPNTKPRPDSIYATGVISPVCHLCAHYDLEHGRACTAFPYPAMIPDAIWFGDDPHTKPYPDDQGVRFQRIFQ